MEGFQISSKTPGHDFGETQETLAPPTEPSEPPVTAGSRNIPQAVMPSKSNLLRLTIDHIPYPAYMVNYNFEITWFNEEARTDLLGAFDHLPADNQGTKCAVVFDQGAARQRRRQSRRIASILSFVRQGPFFAK